MVRSASIRSKIFTSVMVILGLVFKIKFHVWFLGDEHTAAVSVINFTLPLIAAFFSHISLLVTIASSFTVRYIGLFPVKTLGLPTFTGVLVWKMWINEDVRWFDWCFFSWIVPLSCITLFVLHPVGSQAWPYSLYWLLAPLCSFFIPRSIHVVKVFLISLHSTFMVHAIGSLLVLYTTEHSSSYWLNLIPRVAIERLVSAIGMVVMVYGTYCLKVCFYELKPLARRLMRRAYIYTYMIKKRL